ncbi:MAG: Phosphate acetyltransferase [Syntrophaceae bacterium PtaU1.Bin231]|nr:MAG: Phosphate acetyltransferase [Syntrophaceae bacterium PtaU1.Bin231]HOG17768.1 AAA family ATPase [Syntrophales bacterium]
MNRIVVTSTRPSAGKTSLIIGLAKALGGRIGYIKPFGERFLYRKKRLWDYDAALVTNIFGLDENPEDMSIGFHHAKLLFMLDEEATRSKITDLVGTLGKEKDLFFIEAGRDIQYGSAVHLDALSLAQYADADLVVVVSGDEDQILDDVIFLKRRIRLDPVRFRGVVVNKVPNASEFAETRLPKIRELGVNVLGIIPYDAELPLFTVSYLADRLFAKIITGESQLCRQVKAIFIGSMSASSALKNPLFQEEHKVVITSGDRSDMIVAALGSNASAVILTNNIMPPANLIAKASKLEIPLLLVSSDTYAVAKQIDLMESLPTKDDADKIALIEQLINTHVQLKEFGFRLPSERKAPS